jgi:hypothetical protein
MNTTSELVVSCGFPKGGLRRQLLCLFINPYLLAEYPVVPDFLYGIYNISQISLKCRLLLCLLYPNQASFELDEISVEIAKRKIYR